jgi:hypothetical protein
MRFLRELIAYNRMDQCQRGCEEVELAGLSETNKILVSSSRTVEFRAIPVTAARFEMQRSNRSLPG